MKYMREICKVVFVWDAQTFEHGDPHPSFINTLRLVILSQSPINLREQSCQSRVWSCWEGEGKWSGTVKTEEGGREREREWEDHQPALQVLQYSESSSATHVFSHIKFHPYFHLITRSLECFGEMKVEY